MKVELFQMERMQSMYERVVDYELSESGVHALKISELLGGDGAPKEFLELPLGYPHADGTPGLRAAVAATYKGAATENVFVTNGSSEANFIAAWHLFEKGDEIALMTPNYAQMWGLAKTWGLKIKPLWLKEELGWQFDPEDLKDVVTKKTKVIQVCNPNNPTGAIMGTKQRKALLDAARDSGAWLLSDEVYLGAEREAPLTESLWSDYERTLITNGLSKAYGLPGLRIGWLVGQPEVLARVKHHHDYLTLTPAAPSDRLATLALEPKKRKWIFDRTRSILRKNYPVLKEWMDAHGSLFSHVPPAAGAICYVKYNMKIDSIELAERLRKEKSVLIVPGGHFGMDGYMRIGTGPPKEYLHGGLDRVDELLRELGAGKG
ncbi:MAG: Aminotransferase [Candidatus Thermoplasmatota archaeon]|nr:Aminotransferase [Candidatus Thermoplasmatota archaeon]